MRQNVDLRSNDTVSDSSAQSVEIDRLKQTLSEHLKEKESLIQTVTLLKNDFKKEESRNIDREIALEKKIKQLDNIVFKRYQSVQTVQMLMKPQFFYDHTTKQALGFQNPFYLKKAQQLEPKLYDGNVIKNMSAIVIPDSEETLMLAEESRSKMLLKQQDPMMLEKKVNTTPVDYAVLNQLSQDFEKQFVPQTRITFEQAFCLRNSMNSPRTHLLSNPHKHSKLNANMNINVLSEIGCMLSDNHDLCVLDFIIDTGCANIWMEIALTHPISSKGFLGTVKFGNAHVKDSGFIVIIRLKYYALKRFYYVEGLGHKLFSVGQFCDSKLEVAFRQHTGFIRNLEEAVATACYTPNRFIIRLHHGKTPYKLLHDKPLDLSFFHVFGALCYPTNDSENLDFDELATMASEHSSSGPALHEMTPATISSGLMPNHPPSTPFVPPSRTDWDILFQPMFDELLTPPPSVDYLVETDI
ncbi:hypothetical protein Tco_0077177 [Tanacetum coccineum]